jgi:hypothetical protein
MLCHSQLAGRVIHFTFDRVQMWLDNSNQFGSSKVPPETT